MSPDIMRIDDEAEARIGIDVDAAAEKEDNSGPDDPDAADGLSGIEEFADVDPAAGEEVEGCRGVGADVGLMDAMVIGLIDAMVARMAWRRRFFDLDDGGGE